MFLNFSDKLRMCEVTLENFEQLLPSIRDHISTASFVAFDCEFTALHPDSRREMKNSLFDSMESRYRKLASPAGHAIISQLGLSVFQQLPEPHSAQYEVRTYNFYLCPRSFGSVDERWVCQASSLEFLIRYGFDFNKFLYLGISSLNKGQEDKLQRDLEDGVLFRALDRNIPMQDEDRIQEVCSILAVWSSTAGEGERTGPLDIGLVVPLVLHTEIRRRFPCLWSFGQQEGFFVEKVAKDRRAELEAVEGSKQLQEQFLDSMLGFTKVFRHLSQAGKPLVGHNCLLDLLKMFRQFEHSLPHKYGDFKQEIHRLFPLIFDTKHICYDMKKQINKLQGNARCAVPRELEKLLSSSNLSQLHRVLQERPLHPHTPSLITPDGFSRYSGQAAPHEAGFDALMAGSCFLGLGHLAASLKLPQSRPLAFGEKLLALAPHKNRINVARAALTHIHLAGPDPEPNRPSWLHVTSRSGGLGVVVLAEKLARWGSVDVRPLGSRAALVAVGNHCAVGCFS